MITESYISFETAKLLKEKEIVELPCDTYYYKDGSVVAEFDIFYSYNCYDRPTQAVVMRWLREVHNLFICIEVLSALQYECFVVNLNSKEDISQSYGWYLTYEEACEAAILYCLKNLI